MKTQTCPTSLRYLSSISKISNGLLCLIFLCIFFIAQAQSTKILGKFPDTDNGLIPLKNISEEMLEGFGLDHSFSKDALLVNAESNNIKAIINHKNSNSGISANYVLSSTSSKQEDCPKKEKIDVDFLCDYIFSQE